MAVVLSYDELPEGSDIRREMRDGGVRIIIPSGEVPEAVKRRMYRDSLLNVASVGAALLILIIMMLLGTRMLSNLILSPMEWWLAMGLTAIVALALLALIWRVVAVARIESIRKARRQATLLDVDAQRIMLEQSGPSGPISSTLPAGEIKRVGLIREWLVNTLANEDADGVILPFIEILPVHGHRIIVGRGREEVELQWICNTINSVIRKSAE